MLTLNELSSILNLSHEQTKELVLHTVEESPGLDWHLGPSGKIHSQLVKRVLETRGLAFPKARIITFAALKGGIGKTTLTLNVASRVADLGARVLLVDLDPEACATNTLLNSDSDTFQGMTFFDILKSGQTDIRNAIVPSKYSNLDLLPSALINHQAEKFLNRSNPKKVVRDRLESLPYHFIFLELPPSFTMLSASAYLAADLIILPCTPDIYSYESVALTISAINELAGDFECAKKTFRILLNQYNPSRVSSQDILRGLSENYRDFLLPIQIRNSAEISNSTNAGLSVFEANASRLIRKDFHDLAMHIWNDSGRYL